MARITGAADQPGSSTAPAPSSRRVRAGGSLPEGVVRDRPDRPQRGLNLDIARKYYTAGWIEDRLREMADLKLNQLGLHFSDDQGFRIQCDTAPRDRLAPSTSPRPRSAQIVALAARLHITVVPEIDSPGHLGAVLRAHPDLQLRNATGAALIQGASTSPTPRSAEIVDELAREFADLFPRRVLAPGRRRVPGADVVRDPEASVPAAGRAPRGSSTAPRRRVQDLATGWLNDRAAVVRPLGKQPKAWNDGFFAGGVVTAGQGHPGRVLDRQGARRPAADGVPARGPQGGQPQRRVPLLRARRAQPVPLPDRRADLPGVDAARCCAAPRRSRTAI